MKPCVRCLGEKIVRHRAGDDHCYCIIQCLDCGFNVTSTNFKDAEKLWNGFKVWTIVGVQVQ